MTLPKEVTDKIDRDSESQSERFTSSLVDADTRARHYKNGAKSFAIEAQKLYEALKLFEWLKNKYGETELENLDTFFAEIAIQQYEEFLKS